MSDSSILSKAQEERDDHASFESRGVVKIILQSAHIDAHTGCWWSRPPNPFMLVQVDATKATTEAQISTYDPSWLSQTFLLPAKRNADIRLKLYNFHTHRKDQTLLGAASFDIASLGDSGAALNAHLPLLKASRQIGDLSCSLFYYPLCSTAKDETEVGIVRLTLHRVEDLRLDDSKPMATIRVGWDSPPIHATPRQKTGVWDSTHEFLCLNKWTCVVYVEILDPRLEEPVLGHVSICLTDFIEATIGQRKSWPLSGCSAGKLVASAEWGAVNLVS